MNKYFRILIEVPTAIVKLFINKLIRGKCVNLPLVAAMSPCSELQIDKNANVSIGKKYRQRSGSHIRVRSNAILSVGKNVSVNHNCMIVCHEKIEIGDDVQFAPNVMVYDHDHDFRAEGGVKAMKYKSSPIKIGNNVWIGSNAVILRGSCIGDNSVIGAGCIVTGNIPQDSVLVQKRDNTIIQIRER